MFMADGTARTRGNVACCTNACPINGVIAVTKNSNRAIVSAALRSAMDAFITFMTRGGRKSNR